MRKLRQLTPPALLRLDRYLLLHHPSLWATRIHYFLPVLLGFAGLIFFKDVSTKIELSNVPNMDVQFYGLFFPLILLFLYWVYQLGQHKLEKQFGENPRSQQLSTQFIYLLCTALLVSIPFLHTGILIKKADSLIDKSELVEDVNILNTGNIYFSISKDEYNSHPNSDFTPRMMYDAKSPSQMTKRISKFSRGEKLRLIDKYKKVFAKYSGYEYRRSSSQILASYEQGEIPYWDYTYTLPEKHRIIKKNLENITEIKYNRLQFLSYGNTEIVIFLGFLGWMALMVFVRTSMIQFFLTMVTGVVGSIAAIMLTSLGNGLFAWRAEYMLGSLFFIGLLGLTWQAFLLSGKQKHTYMKSIGLGLAAILLPLSPFMFCMLMDINIGYNRGMVEVGSVVTMGIILGLSAWLVFFDRILQDISAAPSQD